MVESKITNLAITSKPFKNSKYITPKKTKNAKQIAQLETTPPPNYNIHPSLKPIKKYCDITGLPAKYTEPKSGLHYYDSSVYQYIKTLEPPMIQIYLSIRNASTALW